MGPARLQRMSHHLLLLSFFCCSLVYGGQAPLPKPLRLVDALSSIDNTNPVIRAGSAAVEAAEALEAIAAASDDLSGQIEINGRWIDPSPLASNQSQNDSTLHLRLSKQLLDFGYTENRILGASHAREGDEFGLIEQEVALQLKIAEAFFAVIEADIKAAREMEAMSVSFVQLQRLRERQELGQVAELEILEKEDEFQSTRHANRLAELRQRTERNRLALLLNRPQDLPEQLQATAPVWVSKQLPELTVMRQAVLSSNPGLLRLEHRLKALKRNLEAERLRHAPQLRAELEASEYARDLSGRNPVTASLVLTMPLFKGERVNAEMMRLQAEINRAEADLAELRLSLNQQVLTVWQEMQLAQIMIEQAEAERDYRELYLDRSRALYEFEQRADLGDAMVRTTEARLNYVKAEHAEALAWARYYALRGGSLLSLIQAVGRGGAQE